MFSNRFFRTIILSRVLLQLGIWIRNFAILLYVTEVTNNDPSAVSLISVAEFAPIFVFAIIGGTFADRWKPKRTMIGCDFLSAFSVLGVWIALLSGSWQGLLLTTLVSAVLSQFSQPSGMKLFKQHVPQDQLQAMMGMYQTIMAVFMVIGPLLGTFVYQHYGIEVAITAAAALFCGSAAVLMLLPRDAQSERTQQEASFRQELMAGLHYVWGQHALRSLGLTFAAIGLASGLTQPLALFIAIDNLGQDKSFLQYLLVVSGAAMLVGGGVVMSIGKKASPRKLLLFGLSASALATLGTGWSESIPLTLALLLVGGFCVPLIQVGINTIILQNTDAAFIGRVGGTITPMFTGMMVIGMSLSGVLMAALTLPLVYSISAFIFVIAVFTVKLGYRARPSVSKASTQI
ncbi:MFS transporter [Paenibacillus sp. BIHB 4019]|uniref:MFS transporter n=1 Tax=Paenibacillus sp. BIHB 4019 TaxID=1870819 RepID=A0A1B2DNG8_9BACL|nr:MFS transporter [Paenibacillus sp. BIHB 4019]ANY69254.1 MFS transporter [Paenibacillus sp. BIHB 4019]